MREMSDELADYFDQFNSTPELFRDEDYSKGNVRVKFTPGKGSEALAPLVTVAPAVPPSLQSVNMGAGLMLSAGVMALAAVGDAWLQKVRGSAVDAEILELAMQLISDFGNTYPRPQPLPAPEGNLTKRALQKKKKRRTAEHRYRIYGWSRRLSRANPIGAKEQH
jgi:hypothetical protein